MLCEVCGKRNVQLYAKEQKPPFRLVAMCDHCYELGKNTAYKGWKIDRI